MPRDDATERLPREQSPQLRDDEALRQRINAAWSRLIHKRQAAGDPKPTPTDATPASERDDERPTFPCATTRTL